MRHLRWATLAALVIILSVAGVALGHGAKGDRIAKGSANGTDRAFVALMIPHHTGGVELGKLAAEKGTNPEVVRLGREIEAEQSREIVDLQAMARRLGVTPYMPQPIEEREMIDMERLRAASGVEFDRMWLDVISAHHMGAIQMALIERNGGVYRPATTLASSIIESQSAQLAEFNRLTRTLGG